MPIPADFTSPDEVIVHHHVDAVPDSLNRLQFVVFWLSGSKPNGIAGQVFNTSLAAFVDDEEMKGNKVRVVTS